MSKTIDACVTANLTHLSTYINTYEYYKIKVILNKTHLLSGIGWKIKYQNGQKWNSNTWNNQIDGIKQGLSSESHEKCDVCE